MPSEKMDAGAPFPDFTWPLVDGGRLEPALGTGWRLLVVYRGRHCPICKSYLSTLESLREDCEQAGISIAAISADSRAQAEADVAEHGWRFPVAFGLGVAEMRGLGLYVSDPRTPSETDHQFSEPAAFVINPEGRVHVIDVSNAPFARPDLKSLVGGIKYIKGANYPIRGTA
jgi:peroxiredoxin